MVYTTLTARARRQETGESTGGRVPSHTQDHIVYMVEWMDGSMDKGMNGRQTDAWLHG